MLIVITPYERLIKTRRDSNDEHSLIVSQITSSGFCERLESRIAGWVLAPWLCHDKFQIKPSAHLCSCDIRSRSQKQILSPRWLFKPEALLAVPDRRLSVESPSLTTELHTLHVRCSSNNRLLHILLGLWLIHSGPGELSRPINSRAYIYTRASWALDHLRGKQSWSWRPSAPLRRRHELGQSGQISLFTPKKGP